MISDRAVLRAVNLAAIVHNLLTRYERAVTTDDEEHWESFYLKMYELSDEYNTHRDDYEAMRQEWVRRCERGLDLNE